MRHAQGNLATIALGLAALTCGCAAPKSTATAPAVSTPEMAAATPDFACPWVDAERGRAPVPLPATAAALPATFVPGCAIVRFNVAADGSVYKPALRAANPLNAGPTALAALQTMRFQPALRPGTPFVLRMSLQKDSAGHLAVFTETRRGFTFFGGAS